MSDYSAQDHSVTSPTLATDPGIVHSAKQFSDNLTLDLTDTEISQAFEITMRIKSRYESRFRSKFSDTSNFTVEDAARMIDEMEDEIVTTLAERLDLIATVDMTPVFEGQPPVIEFIGALPSHYSAKYGMDHEKKEYEVKKSVERGEDYYGQKYSTDTAAQKKRNRK